MLKKKITIQELWTEFQKQVMHPQSPAIQVVEMRKAFFAGVATMQMIALCIGEDDISEDEGADWLEQLFKEVEKELTRK